MPSAAKNPGETERVRACGSSAAFSCLMPSTVNASPPPGYRAAECDLLDGGYLLQASADLAVEPANLFGRLAERHHRDVDREHALGLESRPRRLQLEQCRHQHARARHQHERRGDLRDREHPQPAARRARDAQTAARQCEAV